MRLQIRCQPERQLSEAWLSRGYAPTAAHSHRWWVGATRWQEVSVSPRGWLLNMAFCTDGLSILTIWWLTAKVVSSSGPSLGSHTSPLCHILFITSESTPRGRRLKSHLPKGDEPKNLWVDFKTTGTVRLLIIIIFWGPNRCQELCYFIYPLSPSSSNLHLTDEKTGSEGSLMYLRYQG